MPTIFFREQAGGREAASFAQQWPLASYTGSLLHTWGTASRTESEAHRKINTHHITLRLGKQCARTSSVKSDMICPPKFSETLCASRGMFVLVSVPRHPLACTKPWSCGPFIGSQLSPRPCPSPRTLPCRWRPFPDPALCMSGHCWHCYTPCP